LYEKLLFVLSLERLEKFFGDYPDKCPKDYERERLQISTKICTFCFSLPKNWSIIGKDGLCYVKEQDHPFMALLRHNFLNWVKKTVPNIGEPDVTWINGIPVVIYLVSKSIFDSEGDVGY
jgi:hypothetical protein